MQLKRDKYKQSRGGYSRLLKVCCTECGSIVCNYQKDGSGPLKRLYADRILSPGIKWKNNKKLVCKKSHHWLGIGTMYIKEDRPCFILFQDSVSKKIIKL